MMINFVHPWFWWPLIGSGLSGAVWTYAAYYYSRKHRYPRKAKASGFKGIVRDTAKYTLVGSGAGLVTSILAKELDKFGFFRDAMIAILIISVVAAILNYWMAAALDGQFDEEGKSVRLTTPLWEMVHGAIFGLSIASMGALLAVIVAFAAKF